MELLERLRALFDPTPAGEGRLAADRSGGPVDADLRLATVALLLEVAYGDEEYLQAEQKAIFAGIRREFGLGREEARELMESAEWSRPPKVTLAELTRLVRDSYEVDQRQRVMALVWKVAEVDGVVQSFEDVFTTDVAALLGLSAEQAEEAHSLARSPDF